MLSLNILSPNCPYFSWLPYSPPPVYFKFEYKLKTILPLFYSSSSPNYFDKQNTRDSRTLSLSSLLSLSLHFLISSFPSTCLPLLLFFVRVPFSRFTPQCHRNSLATPHHTHPPTHRQSRTHTSNTLRTCSCLSFFTDSLFLALSLSFVLTNIAQFFPLLFRLPHMPHATHTSPNCNWFRFSFVHCCLLVLCSLPNAYILILTISVHFRVLSFCLSLSCFLPLVFSSFLVFFLSLPFSYSLPPYLFHSLSQSLSRHTDTLLSWTHASNRFPLSTRTMCILICFLPISPIFLFLSKTFTFIQKLDECGHTSYLTLAHICIFIFTQSIWILWILFLGLAKIFVWFFSFDPPFIVVYVPLPNVHFWTSFFWIPFLNLISELLSTKPLLPLPHFTSIPHTNVQMLILCSRNLVFILSVFDILSFSLYLTHTLSATHSDLCRTHLPKHTRRVHV